MESCPVNCKWGSYGEWSICSKTCGGGIKSRKRQVSTPASNKGLECVGNATETVTCNVESCPVNCKWGSYSEWSTCSKSCGGGENTRKRKVAIPNCNGGLPCEGEDTETKACNTDACPGIY